MLNIEDLYTTYILFSPQIGKYYTGHSGNFDRRIAEHNSGQCDTTRRGLPWEVVFTRNFDTRSEAIHLEMKIKKRGAHRYLQDIGIK